MNTHKKILLHLLSASCAAYEGNNVTNSDVEIILHCFAKFANVSQEKALQAVKYCCGLSESDTLTYLNNLQP